MTVAELQKMFLPTLAPEDFFILLAHATKKEKVFLLAHPEYALDPKDETLAEDCFRRRLKHEPTAYIVGHKEFYGYDFFVTQDTLVPRPETEQLVELALNRILNLESRISAQKERPVTLVDIGTGSGNIVISLAKTILTKFKIQNSRFNFIATDISEKALAVAKENAKIHNVDQMIAFLHGDLLDPCLPYIRLDREIIITANLPYLSREIYQATADDVKKFEPENALVSDQAGLEHYHRLLDQIKALPKPAVLFLEISPEQTVTLKKYIHSLFPSAKVHIHKDLAQKERIVEIRIQ